MNIRVQFLLLALLVSPAAAEVQKTPLGLFYVGEERTVNVVCHNAGAGNLTIGRAETSCECLEPDFSSAPVAAGATAYFRFRYRPKLEGTMRVDITFHSKDENATISTSVTGYVVDRDRCLSARQWLEEPKNAAGAIVDLRNPQRFAAGHLNGSLNISAFALVHDVSRRQQRLVLIDEGFAPAALAEFTAKLRQAGFVNVRFVTDGVAGWIRAGGAVEGIASSSLAAAQIAPAELARAQATDPWELVTTDDFQTRGRVASSSQRVAIVASDEIEYATVEAALKRDESPTVFFLSGGMEALSHFRTQQALVAQNSGAVFQTRTQPSQTAASSGCSTCPGRR